MSASLWRIEDGKLRLSFHAGQAEAWQSERRFILMLAGSQGGKTSFGPWWLQREIRRLGSGDYLAATSSFDMFKLKMLPTMQEVFEHLTRSGRYWSGDRVMEIADPVTGRFLANRADDPMYARIILRSAAAGGGLEAATAKGAWLDECGQEEFTVETWEAVLRRLALAQGRVLLTSTPYFHNWLKSSVFDRWTAGDPDYAVIQFDSVTNPAFPQAEFERAKASMPGWRFDMMHRGQWTRPHGLIYQDFDPQLMVVVPFEVPGSWPTYAGCDFGGVNTAFVWLAEEPGAGRYFLFRESLAGGLSSKEHAASAKAMASGRNLVACWGGAGSEEQWRRDFSSSGFHVREPPVADVEAGINRVTQLFREKRLYLFRSCKGTLDELATYRRKLDTSGQPTEEIANKRAYHHLDSLRYVAAGLVRGGNRWIPAALASDRGMDMGPAPFGQGNGATDPGAALRQGWNNMGERRS